MTGTARGPIDDATGETARESSMPDRDARTFREHLQTDSSPFVGAVLLPCLSGQYSALRDLGSGGEANVVLVADEMERRWVVKQYHRQGWSPSVEVLERLADARADHTLESWGQDRSARGVVWLQESGTDPSTGLFFEVMEFIDGGSLSGRVREWSLADLARGLANAVAGFHLLVGAHRDIKPSNVLVRSEDEPVFVLVDLGLARDVSEDSRRLSKREGSAAYQAPEASQGLVSRAGDWWSVGMIVAEAALGFHPFARGDGSLLPDQVIQAELAQRDVPHLDVIDDDRVRLLCRGLLTRDADRRWGKAQVLAWLKGESPEVVAGSSSGGPSKRVRRVLFEGTDFTSPEDLASALATHPQRAGELIFLAKDQTWHEDFRLMLQDHGLNEAYGFVSSYRSGAWQPTFLRLVAEMNPQLTPELSGVSMTPHAAAEVAREVIEAGAATERQREYLAWITEHDVWRIWRGLPEMTDATASAGRLARHNPAEALRRAGDGRGLGIYPDHRVDWVDGDAGAGAAGVVELLSREAVSNFWSVARPLVEAWWTLISVDPQADQLLSGLPRLVSEMPWWQRIAASGATMDRALAQVGIGLAREGERALREEEEAARRQAKIRLDEMRRQALGQAQTSDVWEGQANRDFPKVWTDELSRLNRRLLATSSILREGNPADLAEIRGELQALVDLASLTGYEKPSIPGLGKPRKVAKRVRTACATPLVPRAESSTFTPRSAELTLLAFTALEGTVLWNPTSGEPPRVFHHHKSVHQPTMCVALGVIDARVMVAMRGGPNSLDVWDYETREVVRELCHDEPECAAFEAVDGRMVLATGGREGSILVWDPGTGDLLRTFSINSRDRVSAVSFAAEGGRPVLLAGCHGSVIVWDYGTGDLIRTVSRQNEGVTSIQLARLHGKVIMACAYADRGLSLWDLGTGELIREWSSAVGPQGSIVFGGVAGQLVLASASIDGSVRLWDPGTGECLFGRRFEDLGTVTAGTVGGRITVASQAPVRHSEGPVRIWDPLTGRAVKAGPSMHHTAYGYTPSAAESGVAFAYMDLS